jgi:hypothetical protein
MFYNKLDCGAWLSSEEELAPSSSRAGLAVGAVGRGGAPLGASADGGTAEVGSSVADRGGGAGDAGAAGSNANTGGVGLAADGGGPRAHAASGAGEETAASARVTNLGAAGAADTGRGSGASGGDTLEGRDAIDKIKVRVECMSFWMVE